MGYHRSFALLLIPALASLAVLAAARIFYPDPRQLALRRTRVELAAWPGFGCLFRADTVAAALVGAGFADFALIAFHLTRAGIVPPAWYLPQDRRATAYGLFDAVRGTAWLAGSVVLGLLYGVSLPGLVAASLVLQLAALPVLLLRERH